MLTMLRRFISLVLAGITLSLGVSVNAAPAASAMGVAHSVLIRPLTVHETQPLDFGVITNAAGSSGSVTVTVTGSAVYHGGAQQVCGTSGCLPPHPAQFVVAGEAQHAYSVTIPPALWITGQLSGGGAAPTLVVTSLLVSTNSRPGGNTGSTAGILDVNGSDQLMVGGTLMLPSVLVPAHYSASFPVTAAYQ